MIVYYREKEEVGRLKETHNEEEFFTNLPREFRVMLTHIKSLSYFDTPDYELLSNVFLQAMNRLGEFVLHCYHDICFMPNGIKSYLELS